MPAKSKPKTHRRHPSGVLIPVRTPYEAALEAVKSLFGDTRVSKETTKRDLKALRDEIDIMLDTLR